MGKKFTSTVAGGAIFISLTNILSKGLGFFREIIFAAYFGLSEDFDIYLVGAALPLTINVIIYYLAQNYLIPAYKNLHEKKPDDSESFIQLNLYLFIAGGIIITGILYLFSNLIIDFYLFQASESVKQTAANIFRIFIIAIPFNAAISVLSAFFNIKFEFRFPAYSQLILNASFLIILISLISNLGIYVIPVGYLIGSIIQLAFLVINTKINYKYNSLIKLITNLKEYMPKALLVIILIETIGQLYLLVDRYFYNLVPTGGIAALNYAQITFHLPLSILSVALATVLFPRFSDFISKNLFDDLRRSFQESIKMNIVLFIPITFILIFFGDLVLKILFERGKFTSSDTSITSNVLFYFALSLLIYSIYGVFNKMLYSLGQIKYLLYITIFGIFIKILLNYILVENYLQDGLAISTSVSYFFFFIASYFLIVKRISFKGSPILIKEISICTSIAFLALFISEWALSFMEPTVMVQIFKVVIFLTLFVINLIVIDHSSISTIQKLINSNK